jgi:hypothetical protein
LPNERVRRARSHVPSLSRRYALSRETHVRVDGETDEALLSLRLLSLCLSRFSLSRSLFSCGHGVLYERRNALSRPNEARRRGFPRHVFLRVIFRIHEPSDDVRLLRWLRQRRLLLRLQGLPDAHGVR